MVRLSLARSSNRDFPNWRPGPQLQASWAWGHENISGASFKIILQFPSAGSLKNSSQLFFPLVYFEYFRPRFLLVPGQQNLGEFLSYFQNSHLSDTFTITSEGFLDIKDRGIKGRGYFPKLCSKDKDMEEAGRLVFLQSRLLSEWKNIFPPGQSWFPYYYPIHVLWGSLECPIVHLYASEILTSRVSFFFFLMILFTHYRSVEIFYSWGNFCRPSFSRICSFHVGYLIFWIDNCSWYVLILFLFQ